MKKLLPAALTILALGLPAYAQQEGPLPTQVLITAESKQPPTLTAKDVTIQVNKQKITPDSMRPVNANEVQIALLIDDGLRESVGREMGALRNFVAHLPEGTEVFVGYLANGRVMQSSPFTTDHATAAASLRLPAGLPGISASPYFGLSEFAKHWPTEGADPAPQHRKARFVLMVTNGVDPYNGSTSPLNQNSPYVDTAIRDAQRAGVSVSSIYFADSGFRAGGRSAFSGQSYLGQVAEATGGRLFYQGTGNPVSTVPFLEQFTRDIGETYVASFPAEGRDLIQLKVKSNAPGVKLRAPQQIMPGNAE